MRVALVNPKWTFDGSIYFGCREPHLPLEYGYSKVLLERQGHEVTLIDGQLDSLPNGEIRNRLEEFRPNVTVVTTAPSYLFWRCAPPELRVPKQLISTIRDVAGVTVAIGPHISTTPRAALQKLGADVGVIGEPEDILPKIAAAPRSEWSGITSICYRLGNHIIVQGGPNQADMSQLPSLTWPIETIRRHRHHHHRFESLPEGPGAEMEVSRGYCKRPLPVLLDELDKLIGSGVRYIYFIDEIFLPDREFLSAAAGRNIKFGIQTQIDLWQPDMLDLLGRAGCVSIEAGVESITEEGERLIVAKKSVPFVQANLIERFDEEAKVERWRDTLQAHGVWANKPVPLFPYPGSLEYARIWGQPDDLAWERAHTYYLHIYSKFSDVREQSPLSLAELERTA